MGCNCGHEHGHEKVERYYYKCPSCLSVVAVNGAELELDCDICEVPMIKMGRVGMNNNLVKDKIECVCDARCTMAHGPECVCGCGGKNHGIGMVGFVKVAKVVGKAPTVEPIDREAAIIRRDEYRAAIAMAKAEMEKLPMYGMFGKARLSYDVWTTINLAKKRYVEVRDMKVHSRRMAEIAKFIEKCKSEVVRLSAALAPKAPAAVVPSVVKVAAPVAPAVDWNVFQSGKYNGKSIDDVLKVDKGYVRWLIENQMSNPRYTETLKIAKEKMSAPAPVVAAPVVSAAVEEIPI